MSKSFYKISLMPEPSDAWQLSSGTDQFGNVVDSDQLTIGKRYTGPLPTHVQILKLGHQILFNMASFGVPVIETSLLQKIRSIATTEIDSYPVVVEKSNESFEIVNFLDVVDCFDYERTEYTLWPDDDVRVDKRGKLRIVSGLRIDSEKANGHQIFRVQGWETSLIVSEDIANILRLTSNSGVTLLEVS